MSTATAAEPTTPALKRPARKPSVSSAPSPVTLTAAQERRASDLFRLTGDLTRLRVLLLLSSGERHVNDLCQALGQSQPAVSHHLALLRVSGLVEARREGKHNFYGLSNEAVAVVKLAMRLGGEGA